MASENRTTRPRDPVFTTGMQIVAAVWFVGVAFLALLVWGITA